MRFMLFAAAALALAAVPARAEWQLSIYGGDAITHDSDVTLQQPDGTNLTLNDVSWASKSFEDPPYYGVRLTYWNQMTDWGVALDFTHAKTYGELGDTVSQSGTIAGAAAPSSATVNSTFSKLEFTDGLNLLTLNGMRRWHWNETVSPYAGLGVGLAIPHVEVTTALAPRTFDFQVTGVAAQGLTGLNFKVADYMSLFTEYKLSYAQVDADLDNGGSLDTDIWTHHFIAGLSFDF